MNLISSLDFWTTPDEAKDWSGSSWQGSLQDERDRSRRWRYDHLRNEANHPFVVTRGCRRPENVVTKSRTDTPDDGMR
jgi:hypothetical protein